MKAIAEKPMAATCAEITELARQSRERALAARKAATELTPEEAAGVGGGLLIAGPFPWGVLPFLKYADMFKTNVTSPAGGFTMPTDIASGRGF